MGRSKEDAYVSAYKELCDYVHTNGKAEKGGKVIYWETYPICLKEKCIDGLALMPYNQDGIPVFRLVPYNTDGKTRYNPYTDNETLDPEEDITSLRTARTITGKILLQLLDEMQKYDLNKKRK
jgi:hypothetical protein